MLRKPGKEDQSTTRAWRPIALLSCLGKGLERLIARRMAYLAVNEGVLAPTHIGSLPKRSAGDLAGCLVHDVERAWAKGKKAALLTMDVQGAFDAVRRNRLALRMREQGWPIKLCEWVHSFISGRSTAMRMGADTLPVRHVACGLPQGSPASPILFALFLEPLVRGGQGVSAYVDDLGVLATGGSTAECAAGLEEEATRITNWGAANGVEFDPAKCDLVHFTRGREPGPPVRVGDQEVAPSREVR